MSRRGRFRDLILAALVFAIVGFVLTRPPRMSELRGSDDGIHQQWIGTEAPPLTITALDGQTVRLEQLRGRPIVAVFWATWCAACRRELPHLNRLAREAPEVAVLGLSDEPEATVRTFAAKQPFDFPVASLPSPPAPFDIKGDVS